MISSYHSELISHNSILPELKFQELFLGYPRERLSADQKTLPGGKFFQYIESPGGYRMIDWLSADQKTLEEDLNDLLRDYVGDIMMLTKASKALSRLVICPGLSYRADLIGNSFAVSTTSSFPGIGVHVGGEMIVHYGDTAENIMRRIMMKSPTLVKRSKGGFRMQIGSDGVVVNARELFGVTVEGKIMSPTDEGYYRPGHVYLLTIEGNIALLKAAQEPKVIVDKLAFHGKTAVSSIQLLSLEIDVDPSQPHIVEKENGESDATCWVTPSTSITNTPRSMTPYASTDFPETEDEGEEGTTFMGSNVWAMRVGVRTLYKRKGNKVQPVNERNREGIAPGGKRSGKIFV